VLVELNEQLADVVVDVVADLADAFERQVLRSSKTQLIRRTPE
jgi:hypothetical protein